MEIISLVFLPIHASLQQWNRRNGALWGSSRRSYPTFLFSLIFKSSGKQLNAEQRFQVLLLPQHSEETSWHSLANWMCPLLLLAHFSGPFCEHPSQSKPFCKQISFPAISYVLTTQWTGKLLLSMVIDHNPVRQVYYLKLTDKENEAQRVELNYRCLNQHLNHSDSRVSVCKYYAIVLSIWETSSSPWTTLSYLLPPERIHQRA